MKWEACVITVVAVVVVVVIVAVTVVVVADPPFFVHLQPNSLCSVVRRL